MTGPVISLNCVSDNMGGRGGCIESVLRECIRPGPGNIRNPVALEPSAWKTLK